MQSSFFSAIIILMLYSTISVQAVEVAVAPYGKKVEVVVVGRFY